ncbi:hypothetical protein CEXT_532401 [Caerostris extrusa]|uniref:Uncharacterized protein n=1 Tax=Caerostris extrusa TaxID=172846 RepID=A0AAV4P2G1_CAEEX|nr:hypothetical protein CEXT_532401 [Caerostris extrusa]
MWNLPFKITYPIEYLHHSKAVTNSKSHGDISSDYIEINLQSHFLVDLMVMIMMLMRMMVAIIVIMIINMTSCCSVDK